MTRHDPIRDELAAFRAATRPPAPLDVAQGTVPDVPTKRWPVAPWGACAACGGRGWSTWAEQGRPDNVGTNTCPTCRGTGSALPADREREFLKELAAVWAAAGGGRMEGIARVTWDPTRAGAAAARWRFRLRMHPTYHLSALRVVALIPALMVAPCAARVLLDAARKADALGFGGLRDDAVGSGVACSYCKGGYLNGIANKQPGNICPICDSPPARAVTMLLAETSGGRYTARAERDLPVLRLLVGLQGEVGEVLRRLGHHAPCEQDIYPPPFQALPNAPASLFAPLGLVALHGVWRITPRGLSIARALWGGCKSYEMDRPVRQMMTPFGAQTIAGQVRERHCTLVAGHTGACRWGDAPVPRPRHDAADAVRYAMHGLTDTASPCTVSPTLQVVASRRRCERATLYGEQEFTSGPYPSGTRRCTLIAGHAGTCRWEEGPA